MDGEWKFEELPQYDGNSRLIKDSVRDVLREMREAEESEAADWRDATSAMSRAACAISSIIAIGTTSLFGAEFYCWLYGSPWQPVTHMPWTFAGLASSVCGLVIVAWYGITGD